ncbi:MAG: glutathione S-transferase family protein [Pseudomonadota bacterium]
MYEVFGGRYTRTGLVLMVLDYAGIRYRLHDLDMRHGAFRTPGFLALNPAGYVPVLRTPAGEVLHEAPAIMLYLAEEHALHTLAPPAGDPERGAFLSGLFFCTNDIQPEIKRFYFPERFAAAPGDAARVHSMARDVLTERFAVVDARFDDGRRFYLGDRFTLLDMLLAFWATSVHPAERFYAACPRIEQFVSRVLAAHPCTGHVVAHEQSSREYWEREVKPALGGA